jgi:hypothetical protein
MADQRGGEACSARAFIKNTLSLCVRTAGVHAFSVPNVGAAVDVEDSLALTEPDHVTRADPGRKVHEDVPDRQIPTEHSGEIVAADDGFDEVRSSFDYAVAVPRTGVDHEDVTVVHRGEPRKQK